MHHVNVTNCVVFNICMSGQGYGFHMTRYQSVTPMRSKFKTTEFQVIPIPPNKICSISRKKKKIAENRVSICSHVKYNIHQMRIISFARSLQFKIVIKSYKNQTVNQSIYTHIAHTHTHDTKGNLKSACSW